MQRRRGRARISDATEECVLQLPGGVEAEFPGERRVAAGIRPVEHEAGEIGGLAVELRQQSAHGLAHVGAIAVVDDEAVLPGVDEGVALGAPDVDHLVGDGVRVLDRDGRVPVADQKGRCRVAEIRLQRGARRGHAGVADDD